MCVESTGSTTYGHFTDGNFVIDWVSFLPDQELLQWPTRINARCTVVREHLVAQSLSVLNSAIVFPASYAAFACFPYLLLFSSRPESDDSWTSHPPPPHPLLCWTIASGMSWPRAGLWTVAGANFCDWPNKFETVSARRKRAISQRSCRSQLGSTCWVFTREWVFTRQYFSVLTISCPVIFSASHTHTERNFLYKSRYLDQYPFGKILSRRFTRSERR